MSATVTFLPGVLTPEERERSQAAELARREAGRCPDSECRQLPPNHLWDCGAGGDSGPEGGAA